MILVDTSFFLALWSARDPDHARAREVFESYSGRRLQDLLVTTNHVIFETLTLARRRAGISLAVAAGERLYSEKIARIHWATPEEEKAAFSYMANHQDKHYSAVDCLSFVVMERQGITEALTLDGDFTHRFIARPGPA